MKKILIYVVIVIAVIAAVVIFTGKSNVENQPPTVESNSESVAPASNGQVEVLVEESISQELQGIDLGDLEKEFEAIDQDLQSL